MTHFPIEVVSRAYICAHASAPSMDGPSLCVMCVIRIMRCGSIMPDPTFGHAAEYAEIVRLAWSLSIRAVERLGELMASEDPRGRL
jgi:hypothetical protein